MTHNDAMVASDIVICAATDDPDNPTQLTLFADERPELLSKMWITIDYDHAVDLEANR